MRSHRSALAYIVSKAITALREYLPDELYIKLKWWVRYGSTPDLKNPRRYNEKLNWLKLHDHNPLYTTLSDKWLVKERVASVLGPEHVIPLYGVWDSFDKIDFDSLPEQFVLKCNHDSGNYIICTDKSTFDYAEARRRLTASLRRNYYYYSREWPYKEMRRRILAEKYMADPVNGYLVDYKFFCFDGKVKAMYITTRPDPHNPAEQRLDYFDENFNHLPFVKEGHLNADTMPAKPATFDQMKHYAETLSAGLTQVRVDFDDVGGKIYFGEFTFFSGGGFQPFIPDEWDYRFGELLTLPKEIPALPTKS